MWMWLNKSGSGADCGPHGAPEMHHTRTGKGVLLQSSTFSGSACETTSPLLGGAPWLATQAGPEGAENERCCSRRRRPQALSVQLE
jgi:hypothetical protein